MGIASVCPNYFKNAPFENPFKAQENINAAAFTLKKLMETGNINKREDILSLYFTCGKVEKAKNLYPELYENILLIDKVYKLQP